MHNCPKIRRVVQKFGQIAFNRSSISSSNHQEMRVVRIFGQRAEFSDVKR